MLDPKQNFGFFFLTKEINRKGINCKKKKKSLPNIFIMDKHIRETF